jgi:dihydrofolate reductase
MKRNLIDTFVLIIHPLVLGQGRRMFDDQHGNLAKFKLSESIPTTTGCIIATYTLA